MAGAAGLLFGAAEGVGVAPPLVGAGAAVAELDFGAKAAVVVLEDFGGVAGAAGLVFGASAWVVGAAFGAATGAAGVVVFAVAVASGMSSDGFVVGGAADAFGEAAAGFVVAGAALPAPDGRMALLIWSTDRLYGLAPMTLIRLELRGAPGAAHPNTICSPGSSVKFTEPPARVGRRADLLRFLSKM